MATGLAAVVAGGYLGGLVASEVVDDLAPVDPGPLALALLGSYLCFLAVGGVALLVASLVRAGGRVVGWAAGFVIVSYAVDYLAAGVVRGRAARPALDLPLPRPPGGAAHRARWGRRTSPSSAGSRWSPTAAALALVGRRDLAR